MFYTVTICWQNQEIGYGEAYSRAYALQEAKESVDPVYLPYESQWETRIRVS